MEKLDKIFSPDTIYVRCNRMSPAGIHLPESQKAITIVTFKATVSEPRDSGFWGWPPYLLVTVESDTAGCSPPIEEVQKIKNVVAGFASWGIQVFPEENMNPQSNSKFFMWVFAPGYEFPIHLKGVETMKNHEGLEGCVVGPAWRNRHWEHTKDNKIIHTCDNDECRWGS